MPDVLEKSEHQQIFADVIVPHYLAHLKPQTSPKAIFLAGQPGAGKGGMGRNASQELGDCVVVDPDELRPFHPRYSQYQQEDPDNAASQVHPDASAWAKELIKESIKRKVNVIVDGTLASPDSAIKKIGQFKDGDYAVEIHAIAVKKEISKEGVRARYERAAAEKRDLLAQAEEAKGKGEMEEYARLKEQSDAIIPRNVPDDIQDHAYDGMMASIDRIQKEGLVDRMAVFERGNGLLADTADGGDPLAALVKKRTDPMTIPEAEQYKGSTTQTLDWMRGRVEDFRTQGRDDEADELDEQCEVMLSIRAKAFQDWMAMLDALYPTPEPKQEKSPRCSLLHRGLSIGTSPKNPLCGM
ncbi:MAG: putative ABC-type ATPase [Myxococcota bacterium]|jgi:predicted ABC-type ATPase